MTGLLVTLVLFPVVGLAIGRIAGPVQPFLAGTGAIGAIVFVAGVLHVPIVATVIAIVVAAIVILIVRPAPKGPRLSYPIVPTILAAAIVIVLLTVTAIVPLDDYDGRAFWLLKAKAIAFDRSVDGPFFHLRESWDSRNQYPLLVPIDAGVLMIAGRDLDDRHVRWLYVLFAAGFALELRRRLGAWVAAAFLTLPVIASAATGAPSAYCDIALGAFAACAFFEIVDAVSPLRLGMWLSFVVLTKSEGLPLALLLLTIAAFVFRKRIGIAIAPFAIAAGALLFWRTRIPRSDEEPFARLIAGIPHHARTFVAYLGGFAREMVAIDRWGIAWIGVAVALIVLGIRRQWRPFALVVATIVPMIVLYAAVVAVSPWDRNVILGLAPRLLTQLVGPALYAYAASVSLLDGMPNDRL